MPVELPQHADDLFRCPVHECTLRGRVCVARMLVSQRQMNGRKTTRACVRHADPGRERELARHDGKRGLGLDFPLCRQDRCALGRAVLRAIGLECAADVREGNRRDMVEGMAALAQRDRERLSNEVPTIDSRLREER